MSRDDSESTKGKALREYHEKVGFAKGTRLFGNRFVAVRELMGSYALIHGFYNGVNKTNYSERWEYPTYDAAKTALDAWKPGAYSPTGFTRYMANSPDSGARTSLLKSISNGKGRT